MRQAPHDAIVTEYLDAMQSLHEKEVIVSRCEEIMCVLMKYIN